MAKRKTAADWRVFLRALARTGNARAAAWEAGMDVGTAYDRRVKDERFAARWEAALVRAKALAARRLRSGQAGGKKSGEELVVRKSKRHGVQLVRVGEGRWSAKAEAVFFAELGRTACVRRAAAACGFSTTALYYRRDTYADFAARWAAIEERAKKRLHTLLVEAGIAAFDPEVEGEDLPRVSAAEAIAILRLQPRTLAKSEARPEPSIEEVRDEVLRRIAAIRTHREKGGDETPPP